MNWNDAWYCNPIKEEDYLQMAIYIYKHYDKPVVRKMPAMSLDKLKLFLDDGNCSDFNFTLFLANSGIMSNPEIGKRIYHWLTAEVI